MRRKHFKEKLRKTSIIGNLVFGCVKLIIFTDKTGMPVSEVVELFRHGAFGATFRKREEKQLDRMDEDSFVDEM